MNRTWILQLTLSFVIPCAAAFPVAGAETWKGQVLKNDLIELTVVPQIGGRIIQYRLGDYGFFWVNRQLVNSTPPATGLGPDNSWLNYGGDKLWPAPQGWDNDQQWPGPPDAVLDGQPYRFERLASDGRSHAVRLTSGKDRRSGIQFSRVVRTFENCTRVSIDATMKNIDNKPRRWGIWAHTQLDAGNRHGPGHNDNYWAYCPINPNSCFPRGYDVLYGLVNNMSYRPDYEAGLMKIKYMRRVGKVGVDSHAGWVATVNATDGYLFAHRFEYEPDQPYPENSSVEFWLNGLGEFVAWGKINESPEDPLETPYVFESEVLSPFADLKPGEQYTYHYDWYTARIPRNSEVVACNDVGAVCVPFSARLKQGKIILNGRFGVFHRGHVKVVVTDRRADPVDAEIGRFTVSPLRAFTLENVALTCDHTAAVSDATVRLVLCAQDGEALGVLTETRLATE